MARYPTMHERKANGGWCDWVVPKKGYRMACCDCGLVHVLEFAVHKPSRAQARPGYRAMGPKVRGLLVSFRAKRHKRATAQRRRHMKETAEMPKDKTAGDDRRVGAVKTRSRINNPVTGTWTKRDNKSGKFMDVKADSGKFMDVKADPKPFKGVRKSRGPAA